MVSYCVHDPQQAVRVLVEFRMTYARGNHAGGHIGYRAD